MGSVHRTLFVGNSQIRWHDLPRLVSEISRSSGAGDAASIEGEAFVRSGASLRQLLLHGDESGRDLNEALAVGRYDTVVIAESFRLFDRPDDGYPAKFVADATTIVSAARASGARPVLYATPYAERAGHEGFREMAAPQLELGGSLGVPVATGGLAWLRVWQALPDVDLYDLDRSHPGFRGSYIAALVLYATITRLNPVGLSHHYDGFWSDTRRSITLDEAAVFQHAAWAEYLASGRCASRGAVTEAIP